MNSSAINQFLTTGQMPTSAREKSALLDQLRSQILSTNQPTNQMQSPTIPKTLSAEFLQWKKSNPNGTAQQFTAWKIAGTKPPTPGAGLDPNNPPRLATGKIDSLAITAMQQRQKAAELKIASDAVSRKNPPRRSFVGKQSRYYQPD